MSRNDYPWSNSEFDCNSFNDPTNPNMYWRNFQYQQCAHPDFYLQYCDWPVGTESSDDPMRLK